MTLDSTLDVLDTIDRYCDAQPRPTSNPEDIGPFTLFVATGAFGYYARPRLGCASFTAGDIDAVRARQRELGVAERFEWVADTVPELETVALKASLEVEHNPCLVLSSPLDAAPPDGVSLRFLLSDDSDWAASLAAVDLGFGNGGTAAGTVGPAERDAMVESMTAPGPAATRVAYFRELASRELIRWITAYDETGPIGGGSYHPRPVVSADGSTSLIAEITGIATLPAARRRGVGGAIVAALAADARARGVEFIWMSAGTDNVARVYERVGFRRVGTTCQASPAREESGSGSDGH